MKAQTTFAKELSLSKLPKVNVEKKFYCPVCGLPISIRKEGESLYFVCESPLCSFYKKTSYDEINSIERIAD